MLALLRPFGAAVWEDMGAMVGVDHADVATHVTGLAGMAWWMAVDGADPFTDGVSYRQFVLWLSQAEKAELIEEVTAAIRSRSAAGPAAGRQRHLVSTILFPADPRR